jgi:hypothetical protein
MAKGMTNCKTCGKEIAKGVKKCPHCGKDQRNFFMKHKIITGVLILLILGGIGSALNGGNNKSTSTNIADNSNDNSKPTEAAAKPISISAVDLVKAYDDNEVKADKTYKDVTASITGEVKEVGVMLNQTYVVLSSGEEFSISDVQCFFKDEKEIDKVAELKDGDKVTIQGVIDGKSLNIGVKNCILK